MMQEGGAKNNRMLNKTFLGDHKVRIIFNELKTLLLVLVVLYSLHILIVFIHYFVFFVMC